MIGFMRAVVIETRKQKKQFIKFRKRIYRKNSNFVDDNLGMIKQLFSGKTCFLDNKKVFPICVLDNESNIRCQCVCVYADGLSDYIQVCFFESLEDQFEAVEVMIKKVIEIGKKYGANKLVVGLNGHVNYGLGLLADHFDLKNSFGVSANPESYNDYFKKMEFNEVFLNTYLWSSSRGNRLEPFRSIIDKIDSAYTFKFFDKNRFDYYSKIYTDLNNECFKNHRYYYKRNYNEDEEMLKELFCFMKPESLIFAFYGEKPVGFILWYPDFNELVSGGHSFGTWTYLKNLFLYKKIRKAKIVEIGVLKEYRNSGLAIGLVNQACLRIGELGIDKGESSWILDENLDSNSICKAFCDGLYKRYVVYEKDI